jgi:hypothetical protein
MITIDSSIRARSGSNDSPVLVELRVGALGVHMYQMYQPYPLPLVASLELLFWRVGTWVGQPLDHRWLHSEPESGRKTFSESASVRTTSDSSPAGPCPNTVDERFFWQQLFFCWDDLELESSGLLSGMVY